MLITGCPDGNKNDEDIFSDEKIDRSKVDVDALMNTHVGSTKDNDAEDMDEQNTYALSVQAMQQASRMWPEKSSPDASMKKKYNQTQTSEIQRNRT